VKKVKKILFRADAAPHIGIGDLMSLINLSKYLDDTYEIYFIIKNYQAGLNLIKTYNIQNCSIIDNQMSINDEVSYINEFISRNKINIVFFEITEIKLSSYIGITKNVKKVAINFDGCILDDLDLVIDWDVEADRFFKPEKYPHTKFLLGVKYVILPKEFYDTKALNKKTTSKKKSILIAMGGADEFDLTNKIIKSIIGFNLNIKLNIILGSGYEYKSKLEKLLDNNIEYTIKQNTTNMLNEYLHCDIGIGAGGLTSSELVATKTSTILLATYKHQIARCKYFDKENLAKYLGYKNFKDDDLKQAILSPIQITKNNIFNTQSIVDEIDKLFIRS